MSQAKDNMSLLQQFSSEPKDQLAQLIGIEYVLGHAMPDRCSEASLLLNALYEEEAVDGELIIAWYLRPSAGEQALGISSAEGDLVRQNVKKLIDFIEEEEDDDEEDDDEEE